MVLATLTKAEQLCEESSIRNLDAAGDRLVGMLRSNDLLLCIDRAYARRFIADQGTPRIASDFGLNLVWSRRVVWSIAALRAVCGVASAVLGFVAFGRWGIAWLIVLPVYMARARSSAQVPGGKLPLVGVLASAVVTAYFLLSGGFDYPAAWGLSVMLLSVATIYVYRYPATLMKRLVASTPRFARALVRAKAVWVLRPDEI